MMTPVWFKVEVDEFVFYKPVGDEAKLALPVDVGEYSSAASANSCPTQSFLLCTLSFAQRLPQIGPVAQPV